MMTPINYLAAYSPSLQNQVHAQLDAGTLGNYLQTKYPNHSTVRNDKQLFLYTNELKNKYLRHAPALNSVSFDSHLQTLQRALGTHTRHSRPQGNQLKAKHSLRIASLFKDTPMEFLTMIVVHELAHLKEVEHNKAFYQLCTHMQSDYHQVEFDVRVYLTHLAATGQALWLPL